MNPVETREQFAELMACKPDMTFVCWSHYNGNVEIIHEHHRRVYLGKCVVSMWKAERHYISPRPYDEKHSVLVIPKHPEHSYLHTLILGTDTNCYIGVKDYPEIDTLLERCEWARGERERWWHRGDQCDIKYGYKNDSDWALWAELFAACSNVKPTQRQQREFENTLAFRREWDFELAGQDWELLSRLRARRLHDGRKAIIEAAAKAVADSERVLKLKHARNKSLKIKPMQILAAGSLWKL